MQPRFAMNVDVLVIGGNPGGCAAAVAAARSGRSVLLLEHTSTLGGMNASGTFRFDCATPQALSGIAEEVAEKVRTHYAEAGCDDALASRRENLVWEGQVMAHAWRDVVDATSGLMVETGAVPVSVQMQGRRITEVAWQRAVDPMGNLDSEEGVRALVRPRMVVDASYYGDVAAWSGAAFDLGREARSADEPHAGRIFTSDARPALDGTPPHSVTDGSTGAADEAIMAFACRLLCRFHEDTSPDARHRLRAAPPGYTPSAYRWGPLGHDEQGRPVYFNSLSILPNGKFMLNRLVRGNNLVGPNRDYILAAPAERRALRQKFIDHALGFLYFIQTEGGLPALGLASDEFTDNGHLPYQIYVREGRRIVGLARLTEVDINPFVRGDGLRPPRQRDAVAIGDWTVESHGCSDEVPAGQTHPDGFIFNRISQAPYQVPYGCLVSPDVDNLLVCGALSVSHVAYGAVRCEAARIQTGTAAGVAAALALERDCDTRDLPVDPLQRELIRRKVKLTYLADVDSDHPEFECIQWAALRGYLPAHAQWRFEPQRAVTWAEFAQAAVVCLDVPISVTGSHFEDVSRYDSCFRFVEALYDLGTRAGLDLFGHRAPRRDDPMTEFLRLDGGRPGVMFRPQEQVTAEEASQLMAGVSRALHGTGVPASPQAGGEGGRPLTRSAMCRLLQGTWGGLGRGFAR